MKARPDELPMNYEAGVRLHSEVEVRFPASGAEVHRHEP
jgi:hypothetical protein